MRVMSKKERDMYIMGSLVDSCKKTTKRGKNRIRSRHTFVFSGVKVCRNTFLLVYYIGKHLHKIITNKNTHGVTPRKHGKLGKKPSLSLQNDETRLVVQFISSYAEDFGLLQPAAIRGRDDTPTIYIPFDTTKKEVHEKYVESCPNDLHVRYSTFSNIWNQCLPHIRIAKPRDDVCGTCEQLRKSVLDAVSEEEKSEAARKMQEHTTHAQAERKVCNDCVKRSRDTYHSQDRFVHYTFDFSQNVFIRSMHFGSIWSESFIFVYQKVQLFWFSIAADTKYTLKKETHI